MPRIAEVGKESASTVLRGGRVVAEDFSSTLPADVWIKGATIAAVGDSAGWDLPQETRFEDVTGSTVAPGLVDSHVHLSYLDAQTEEEQDLYLPIEFRTLVAAQMASRVLAAGVTTAIVPGTMGNIAVAIRDAVESGVILGPRIIAGGRYLSPYGNYPSWVPNLPTENLIVVPDEAAIRKAVYSQFLDRVDIVKILGSGEGSTSHIPTFLERDIHLITELAHLEGKRVFMHARAGNAAVYGARAGVDVVLHGDYMTDEQVDEFAESHSAMSPVLCMAANSAAYGSLMGISQQAAEFFRGRVRAAAEVSRKLYDRGVPLIAGSESGFGITPHGEWHFREVELLVEEVGLSPLEAVKAGTANVAAAVGLQDTVGTVAPGRSADLLVVAGDLERDVNAYGDPERRVLSYARGRLVHAVEIEERRVLSFERVRRMTTGVLTREVAASVGLPDAETDGAGGAEPAGKSSRSALWR